MRVGEMAHAFLYVGDALINMRAQSMDMMFINALKRRSDLVEWRARLALFATQSSMIDANK